MYYSKSLGENFTLFLCSISAEAEVLSLSEIVGAPRTDPYPIFLDDLDCMTNDTSLLGCNGGNRGLPTCVHDDDAAVHCEGNNYSSCTSNVVKEIVLMLITMTSDFLLRFSSDILSKFSCDPLSV